MKVVKPTIIILNYSIKNKSANQQLQDELYTDTWGSKYNPPPTVCQGSEQECMGFRLELV